MHLYTADEFVSTYDLHPINTILYMKLFELKGSLKTTTKLVNQVEDKNEIIIGTYGSKIIWIK